MLLTAILFLLLLCLVLCPPAQASYIGTFAGNDDLPSVTSIMCRGLVPNMLGQVENFPVGEDQGFSVLGTLSFEPGEWVAGTWYYPGPEKVNLITVKAGEGWAAYCVLDPCEEIPLSKRSFLASARVSHGEWSTAALGWKGASHITAWNVDCAHAPTPNSLYLVLCGLVPIAVIVLLARKTS